MLTIRELVALNTHWRVLYLGRQLTMDEYHARRIAVMRTYMGWR